MQLDGGEPLEVAFEDVDLAHPHVPQAAQAGDVRVAADAAGNLGCRVMLALPAALVVVQAPFGFGELLSTRVATVKHVPTQVQGDWERALVACLNLYVDRRDLDSLFRLLSLPKLTLGQPRVKGRHSKDHTVCVLRDRLRKFMAGELRPLWDEVLAQAEANRHGVGTRAAAGDAPKKRASRARHLLGEGAPGKALQALLSEGVHDSSDPAILAKLVQLHPQAGLPHLATLPDRLDTGIPDDDALEFWGPLIRESIRAFPKDSAPGPSGLRASHLADTLKRAGHGDGLVRALVPFVKAWVDGELPASHAELLCGASLTALRKKDNGVRPVAVGETWRRLVGKALLATAAAKQEVATLRPRQVGVGTRNAAEQLAIAVQNAVTNLPRDGEWAVMQVDLRNAFNSISRDSVLGAASVMAPTLFNYLRFCYGRISPLFFGDKVIQSVAGTQQGCPLGPVGFALGIHHVLKQLEPLRLTFNTWYLDDGLLVGDAATVAEAYF